MTEASYPVPASNVEVLSDSSNDISKIGMSPSISNTDIEPQPPPSPSPSTQPASPTNEPTSEPPSSPFPTTTPAPKISRPFQFGSRLLDPLTTDPFTHNAWDHVSPPASHALHTESQLSYQRAHPVSSHDKSRFNASPAKWWDLFYKQKSTHFFKDRKWLAQEFPVLAQVTRREAGPKTVLEVGAGAGNTAFPIVRGNENPGLRVHAVDFSAVAVQTMRGVMAGMGEGARGVVRADVWDVAMSEQGENAGLPPGLSEGSVDVVVMIFVFSALSPDQWAQAVRNVWRVLKPGGEVLFRDYGRGDLAQVRFKAGRWMEENFYVRGDGTRVYFFDKEELGGIWGGGGVGGAKGLGESESDGPRFEISKLEVDRRLNVNRLKKIMMYRCWIQGHFRKPLLPALTDPTDSQSG